MLSVAALDTKYLFLRKRLSGVTVTARGEPATGNEKPVSVGAADERNGPEVGRQSGALLLLQIVQILGSH